MIFADIKQTENFDFLNKNIRYCLDYAKKNDLINMQDGKHVIDGENLYVNIATYTTKPVEDCFWEAHKQYIDVHVLLSGIERIDICPIEKLSAGKYDKNIDFLPLEGDCSANVVLYPGDFLVCYPFDAHRTGVYMDTPTIIKKAIFKIVIDNN